MRIRRKYLEALILLVGLCALGWPGTQIAQSQPAIKIAIVNPDNYRIVKFGVLTGPLDTNEYRSMAYGEIEDGRTCAGGRTNPACWTGVGTQQDFIGTILSNAGYSVDYFTSDALPPITSTDYDIVVVQDPLKDNKDNYRQFDKSVETTLPDLLEYTTSQSFVQKLLDYFNSGGRLVLVGDAVRLLEDSSTPGKFTLNFGKTINTDEVANTQSNPHPRIPAKWLFIRGNPFCGVDRHGSGTYTAESGSLLPAGTELADLSFFDGNDIPLAPTWSDTVYYPSDGVSLLDVRVQGSGEYVLRGDICNPPVYTVTVDDVLSHFMGYTTYNGKKIYYIGSDSFFDYHLVDHAGAWHAGQSVEMKYTTTVAGQQAIVNFIQYVLSANPGDVVINEVAWMGTGASSDDEWIELYNTTDQPIDLAGWTLESTTDGSPGFTFNTTDCSNLIIPAGGFLLLERTDDNTVSDIPADCIYTGSLVNSGESLALKDPSGAVIDTANGDGGAWPAGTAGTGSPPYASMERIDPLAPDTDANWATNDGIHRNGLDAGTPPNPINGTPKAANSTINAPPVADAGAAQQVALGVPVVLDGTASTDPDGDPLTYAWRFLERPCDSTATLSDPQAARPTFLPDREGTYRLELVVNDGALASAPAPTEVLVGELRAFWTFDEAAATAADCSGAGHTATVQGPTAVAGLADRSLEFDGVDDRVLIDDPAVFDGLTQGTIELWLKLDGPQPSAGGQREGVVLHLFKDPTNSLRIYVSDETAGGRNVAVRWDSPSGSRILNPAEDLPLGTWTQVALTWGPAGTRLYLNARLKASVPESEGTVLGHAAARLGVGLDAFAAAFFRGQLDHVRLYGRVLDGSELLDHYRQLAVRGQPVLCTGADGLSFTMEEGQNPPPQTLEVFNCGAGTLGWSLTESLDWLSVAPRQGQNAQDVKLRVHALRLPAGTYAGELVLNAPEAQNSPQRVTVTLHVTAGPPRAPRALRLRGHADGRVTLLWQDASFNETGFTVYRDGQPIATVAADQRRFTDEGAVGPSPCYRVAAVNAAGEAPSAERCLVLGTSPPQTVALHWRRTPLGSAGLGTSLALDAQGQPRLAFYDAVRKDLRYARYGPGGWQVETVDAAGDVGAYPALALDGAGRPHLAYYDRSRGALKYARKDQGVWQVETVDREGDVGQFAALTLDASGTVHIAYFDADREALKHAWQDGAGWQVETVDASGAVGAFVALASDGSGVLHLGYYDLGTADLKYARRGPAGWQVETVDTAGDVGQDVALALDGAGTVHLVYHDASRAVLKHARRGLDGWQVETLEATVGGEAAALAVDAQGRLHLTFLVAGSYRLIYAVRDGSGWSWAPVDPQEGGETPSLALDGAGSVHLAYLNAAGTLVYAQGAPAAVGPAFVVRAGGTVEVAGVFHGAGFASMSADVAERFPSREPLFPGEVAEFDPDRPGTVRRSGAGGSLAGVVSARPGLLLGPTDSGETSPLALQPEIPPWGTIARWAEGSARRRGPLELEVSLAELLTRPAEVWLALAGRLAVRADASRGFIRVGDLLTVSSSRPGYAARCERPCSGPLLGKALTPLTAEVGWIEIWVMRP